MKVVERMDDRMVFLCHKALKERSEVMCRELDLNPSEELRNYWEERISAWERARLAVQS